MGWIGRKKGFIDRGKVSSADFSLSVLITDGLEHDLDLSDIIDSGAKSVLLQVYVLDNNANKNFYIYKKGYGSGVNISRTKTLVANIATTQDVIVSIGKDRKLTYFTSVESFTTIEITIKGWWF